MAKQNKHFGSSLDSLLAEDGLLDELTQLATKEVLAWQVKQAMRAKGLSKVSMAHRMNTSRSQVDRLLDPKNGNVTLATMQKAAQVLGKRLQVGLAEAEANKASASGRSRPTRSASSLLRKSG